MRDPNDITAEPLSWFKATEEWLDCHDALTASASRAAVLEQLSSVFSSRAGTAFSSGNDALAQLLREEARSLMQSASEAHAERRRRLSEEELIRVGYGPQDFKED